MGVDVLAPGFHRSPLRIALLTYSTKPRGSVMHTLELAEALQALGHSVCIYALDKAGTGFERSLACEQQLIPAYPAPSGMDAVIQQRIQEFVDYLSATQQTYDIYHAQDCIGANALARLRQQRIPTFVRTVHHIEDYDSAYLQACQSRSIQEAGLCLCVSATWQAQLWQGYQIKALRVINGINTRRFSPQRSGSEDQLKQRLHLTGWPIYLTIGGIEPRKNSITLLKAYAQVLAAYPNAQLIMAGGATVFDYRTYQQEFFALAQELGISVGRSLIVPGVISDIDLPALYRSADAFVFPSLNEGWGLVLLEAIASGLPVITSNQPPFTEFLSAEQAYLVDPQSPEAIAQAMRTILQPDVTRSLRQQHSSILARYTWEASARMHVYAYHQLLANQQIEMESVLS